MLLPRAMLRCSSAVVPQALNRADRKVGGYRAIASSQNFRPTMSNFIAGNGPRQIIPLLGEVGEPAACALLPYKEKARVLG